MARNVWSVRELNCLYYAYKQRDSHKVIFPEYLLKRRTKIACICKAAKDGITTKFTPRRLGVANWDDTEIAYLAGIIDGEGCIYDGTKNKTKGTWRLTINTTDLSLFEWINNKLGRGCSYIERRRNRQNHKQVYTFQAVAMNDVLEILEYVSPYLIIKKEKALECIKYLTEKLA